MGCVAFITALSPIRSWDYFWHLTAGRWMLDNAALPGVDPLAIGSARVQWIDGSWLFQVVLALFRGVASDEGVWLARATVTAALLFAITAITRRRTSDVTALILCSAALWGAWHRLDARPETAGVVCAVLAVLLMQSSHRLRPLWYLLLTVVWINLHPSALLAPVIASCGVIDALLRRNGLPPRLMQFAAGCAGLFVNPWGWEGVVAPFRLARQVGSGGFVNLEWLPSSPATFPLLYLTVAAIVLLLINDRMRHPFEALLLAVLAFLAIRWVRNHAFFFLLMPLLATPLVELRDEVRARWDRVALVTGFALIAGASSVVLRWGIEPGVDSTRFPIRTAAMIESLGLRGNVYVPDQFGGYVMWQLYPEKRVLIDGRNELYAALIPRILRARRDSREWQNLFTEFDLRIAVEEHATQPLEVMDPRTGETVHSSSSLAYFPREQWALVAVDPASMLFVRRDAADPAVLQRIEYREWRPDLVDPSEVRDVEVWKRERIRGEMELAGAD